MVQSWISGILSQHYELIQDWIVAHSALHIVGDQ